MYLGAASRISFTPIPQLSARAIAPVSNWMKPEVRNAAPNQAVIMTKSGPVVLSQTKEERARFEAGQARMKIERESYARTQPHGLSPSSRWNSYSGKPLPEGTRLSPSLQARLSAGQGVSARWSPDQQLWISAI